MAIVVMGVYRKTVYTSSRYGSDFIEYVVLDWDKLLREKYIEQRKREIQARVHEEQRKREMEALFHEVSNIEWALAEQDKKPKITHQDRVFVGERKKKKRELEWKLLQTPQAEDPEVINWTNNNKPKYRQEGQQQRKGKQTHQKGRNYPQQQQQRHKQQPQRGSDPVRPGLKNKGSDFTWGFLFWLFCLLPLVSAQCSTCLGGRCYDTGQCIVGCVPGYMDIYCDKACPSNCLNKACQVNTASATISCTDGCRDGFCGTKCTRHCPEGCTTCDRQCASCNMTLCPERRYGKGCGRVCNQNYEECDRETGQCIKCRQEYYGDFCDKNCPNCFTRGQNLLYKCMSGCKVCREQDPCPDGLFGDNCDLKCPENCGKSAETGRQPCNRGTSECSIGCVSGYHGLTCNYTCIQFCVGRICNQHDGVCTSGCISGYTQQLESCEKLEEKDYSEVKDVSDVIILLVIILVISILALTVPCALMVARGLCRRNRKSSGKYEIGDKTESGGLTVGEP